MKMYVDGLPKAKEDCPFRKVDYEYIRMGPFQEVEWDEYCTLSHQKCDFSENECSCLEDIHYLIKQTLEG